MSRITGMDWLKKQIKEIEVTNSDFKDEINKIRKIKPGIYNEFKAWTPLKLILLNYSLDVCTKIINKIVKERPYIFKEMHYIDLFAGSGLNKIKDSKDDFLIGSPFISTLKYSESYNSMTFCEDDKEYGEALELRLKTIKKGSLKLIKGDCNSHLSSILDVIKGNKIYSFFFIDPYAMEFSWKSMKVVLKLRSDMIFNFMSSQIYREVCAGKSRERPSKKLIEFFGGESWKNANSIAELVEIYKQNIIKERPNALVKIIKVQSDKMGGFCYHLLFITNKTKGGNQWLRAIDKAKEEIESNADTAVELALNVIKGRQTELKGFFE